MSFTYPLAAATDRMRPSPIRELFKVIRRPGMISFAGGYPDPEVFPIDALADCTSVLRATGRTTLQYGATEGDPALVEAVRSRMTGHLGSPVAAENVLITTGSQQVMDLLSRVLLDPGDVVIVEAPTYPGALHTFRNNGARFAPVPCDRSGMLVDELPAVIDRCRATTGRPPKLIYTIVNFSNPAGVCLADERRELLAEVAGRYGIPVLEDDPYGDLRYLGTPIKPLYPRGQGGIVYAGSFSKILAPGVRLAWAIGDPDLIRRMVIAKQGVDLCSSTVDQVLVAEYCRRGELERHLEAIRAHYRGKRDAMAAGLRGLPDSVRFNEPEGGFFFWLDLGLDSGCVFEKALPLGVAFLPGRAFYPTPDEVVGNAVGGDAFARLCFTFASADDIAEGCRRMAAALAQAGARVPA